MSEAVTLKKPKSRIEWIDILRGAMMFLVVCGHALTHKGIVQYIFSFHMPVFFIISGMTFSFNKEWDFVKYVKKKAKGLIIPYFALNLLVSGLWYWNRSIGQNPAKSTGELILGIFISNVDSKMPMASNTTWFITCLFLTDLLFFVFRRLFKKDSTLAAALVITTSTFYAFGGIAKKGGGVWHWQVTFTAVIFYLAGYLFMKNIEGIKQGILKHKLAFTLLAVLFLLDGYKLNLLNGRVSMVNDSYKNPLFFYLSAMATSAALIILMIELSEYPLFIKSMKPVNFIGKNTLTYIAFHVPLIKLARYYFADFLEGGQLNILLCAVLIYIGLLPVAWCVQKFLPFAVGKGFKPFFAK